MNQPLSKEEYQAKVDQWMGTDSGVKLLKEKLNELRLHRIHKYANILNTENSTGDFLVNCQNCNDCYDVNDSQDCKHVVVGVKLKDVMDCNNVYVKPELTYQLMGSIETYRVAFGVYVFESSDVFYSQFIFGCKNLFGCVGLHGKQEYCILNKQYTKEQYEQLLPKIIAHMQSTGEWGQFFPVSTAPFCYNETVAYDYVPLTKEQALARGFSWKEANLREFTPINYLIPDSIKEVSDEILANTLGCENCGKHYKIIKQELSQLRQMNLPIPRNCPDCRHTERMSLRNARKLYDRNCNSCSDLVKTTYQPDRPEKIFCEKCYLESGN